MEFELIKPWRSMTHAPRKNKENFVNNVSGIDKGKTVPRSI
jgi:hypothetical protein